MPRSKSESAKTRKSTPASPASSQVWAQSDWNYAVAIAEVEAVIAKIERDELDLAEIFTEFTTAAQKLQECEEFLAHYQQQFDLVVETLAPGRPLDSDDPDD